MIPQKTGKITPEEYLELEKNSELKHEYFEGEIFAMTGAKPNHNMISFNIAGELKNQLKGSPCMGFTSDQRIKIEALTKYVYPDISIACDEVKFDDDPLGSLLNPVVVFEILSDSTEAYDRGMKFQHYRLLPSLQEYILVSQNYCLVEKYVRNNYRSWKYVSYEKMEQTLTIESINCEVVLLDIYYRVEFEK